MTDAFWRRDRHPDRLGVQALRHQPDAASRSTETLSEFSDRQPCHISTGRDAPGRKISPNTLGDTAKRRYRGRRERGLCLFWMNYRQPIGFVLLGGVFCCGFIATDAHGAEQTTGDLVNGTLHQPGDLLWCSKDILTLRHVKKGLVDGEDLNIRGNAAQCIHDIAGYFRVTVGT